jgi:hypothetical protein
MLVDKIFSWDSSIKEHGKHRKHGLFTPIYGNSTDTTEDINRVYTMESYTDPLTRMGS